MLVLTRKARESICIDQMIEVEVLQIQKGQVKLGISAARDMPVYRKELLCKIQHLTEEQHDVTAQ